MSLDSFNIKLVIYYGTPSNYGIPGSATTADIFLGLLFLPSNNSYLLNLSNNSFRFSKGIT